MAAATDHAVFIAHAQIWTLLLIMWPLLRMRQYGCCSSAATDHVAFIAPVKKMATATDHVAFIAPVKNGQRC